ncbi:hypothetical protein WEI85_47400 [Actinomycetes bacterium KLBMP 9797]
MHNQTVAEFDLPHLAGIVIERIESGPEGTSLFARARAGTASCPACATVSKSVRSRYQRCLADTPVSGLPVWLLLVRRFNCRVGDCDVRTFVEQIPGLTIRRRRRSQPLQGLLHSVGAALAGRAGVRLAAKLAMDVSRSTLLRLLRVTPEPVLTAAPRVLGVDDFALRRGQVYASRRRPIPAPRSSAGTGPATTPTALAPARRTPSKSPIAGTSFAKGLQRDLDAVTAGLTLPWSSGAVEGQVNRVKMLKRQMYGRAKFDLLRRRILQPN